MHLRNMRIDGLDACLYDLPSRLRECVGIGPSHHDVDGSDLAVHELADVRNLHKVRWSVEVLPGGRP